MIFTIDLIKKTAVSSEQEQTISEDSNDNMLIFQDEAQNLSTGSRDPSKQDKCSATFF